jgi:hypothetical protein
VNKWGLLEVNPSNRKFTWGNNQKNLVLAKIDRVFMSTDWEAAFCLVRVIALVKDISDHVSLVVDTGGNCLGMKKKFRFEKWWLERGDFMEVVKKAWEMECYEGPAIDVWQFRVMTLKRLVRGWASNATTKLNKQKHGITVEFYCLDPESESMPLDESETQDKGVGKGI